MINRIGEWWLCVEDWWGEERLLDTPLFYMISTFLILLFVGICLSLLAVPVLLTALFDCWLWLLLWIIMLPLCVGVFCILMNILY